MVGPAHIIMRRHNSKALLKLSCTWLPAVYPEVSTRVRAKLLALLAVVADETVQRNDVGRVVAHWTELKVFGLHESEASLVKTKHYAARTRCKGYVVAGTVGAYLQASGAEMNAITDRWWTRWREVLDVHR